MQLPSFVQQWVTFYSVELMKCLPICKKCINGNFKQLCGFSNNENYHQTSFMMDLHWIWKKGSLVSLANTDQP